MAKANPYDVRDDVEVTYAGFHQDAYAFRLRVADEPGMVSVMFQMKVSQWLFDNAEPGRWHMGNDVTGVDNPGANDIYVLIERMTDVVQFEDEFSVSGLTPSMLVP